MLSNDSTRLSVKPAFSRRISSVKTHAPVRFQGLFSITPPSYISLENSAGVENGTIPEIGIRKIISICDSLGLELVIQPKPLRPTLPQLIKEGEEAGRKSAESDRLLAKNALRKHKNNKAKSLVSVLELSFPYDWSNPLISSEALIINVLKRGIFEDVCKVCAFYGTEAVENLSLIAFKDAASPTYSRQIENIKKGFALNK